ncbi:KAP family NTPase [Enterobacter bugandensis]|uniref:KAP family NTPase n=1 Tax=Enterobacter bugandensis TaxID=881260 RepID=UPI002006A6ED|nr:KAP family NTPase [Enterobacter bugandensis]MCK7396579.1 KAP family NTPase [Enterobacter bugandensis]
MSLEFVKEQLSDFISSEEPEVMAIQGEWGIGKTYTWNTFLKDNKASILFNRYSYVSLFGINSLDSLKYSIFENTITREYIGNKPDLETATTNATGIVEMFSRKVAGVLKEVPVVKNFTSTLEIMSFMTVAKMIVVIDDLERRGKNLEVKDVLGLVSLLKEQKDCKVVLLLNNGSNGMEDYSTYKEKVIDREITYNPTPEECASIAYGNDINLYNLLSKHTISLGIKNIRILKKIERFILALMPKINGDAETILNEVAHSLTLYCWSHYAFSPDGNVPSLEYISNIKNIYIYDKEEGKEKNWLNTLLKYGYKNTNNLDEVLIDMVKYGYIDTNRFQIQVSVRNDEIIRDNKRGSLFEAWQYFHNSFDDNQIEVVEKLYQAVLDGMKYVTPSDLDSVVGLFRDFDENIKAAELIDNFIKYANDALNEYVQSIYMNVHPVKDAELLLKIKEYSLSRDMEDSIGDVLTKLSGQNGWSDRHEVILDSASEDDYYKLFKDIILDGGDSIIATALKFGNYSNGSDRMNRIGEKAKNALIRIGNESSINKIRVKRYL